MERITTVEGFRQELDFYPDEQPIEIHDHKGRNEYQIIGSYEEDGILCFDVIPREEWDE